MTTAAQAHSQTMPCRGCGKLVHYGGSPDLTSYFLPMFTFRLRAWEPRHDASRGRFGVKWEEHVCVAVGEVFN